MQNTLLTTLDTLAKEWRVTFQFRPTEYLNDTNTSLLLLMTEGKRTPAIFFIDNVGMYIELDTDTDQNGKILKPPPIGEWTNITVGQRKEDGEFTFYISINASEVHSWKNNDVGITVDVKVFASNRRLTAQPGSIRRLTIESKLKTSGITVH